MIKNFMQSTDLVQNGIKKLELLHGKNSCIRKNGDNQIEIPHYFRAWTPIECFKYGSWKTISMSINLNEIVWKLH